MTNTKLLNEEMEAGDSTSVVWQETSVKKCFGSQMGAYKENFRTEPFLRPSTPFQ